MKTSTKRMKIPLLAALSLGTASLTAWTLWENTALMTEHVAVSSQTLPATFSGFRIAHISDFHNAEFDCENKGLLNKITETKPDIIAITGDLVDSRHTDMKVALRFVQDAVKIAPVYYTPGNHESRLAGYNWLAVNLEAAGATVLEDKTVFLTRGNEKIILAGLTDPSFFESCFVSDDTAERLNILLDKTDGFRLLLSHRPELFDLYVANGVDLVLSGHAHGGQARLPFVGGIIAPHQGLFPLYDAGLYTKGHTTMAISRGIGNSLCPLRFNNRPEILCIELKAINKPESICQK